MAGEELLGAGEVAEDVVHAGCGGDGRSAKCGLDPGLEFFWCVELLEGAVAGEATVSVGLAGL